MGKDDMRAIGAERRVAVTAVALKEIYLFVFVCKSVVENKITKTCIAHIAVDEEKQVAVPGVVDDLAVEGETTKREFIHFRGRSVHALLNINNADRIHPQDYRRGRGI
jgi:hypothetical protein